MLPVDVVNKMALSGFSWNIVLACFSVLICQHHVTAEDMCAKFNIGGPCQLLPSDGNLETDAARVSWAPESPYCLLACSQGNSELLRDFCPCADAMTTLTTTTPVTTTTTMFTTPRPATCYYSTQRPARLSSVRRRLYSSVPAVPECEFPGVVGLFYELQGKMRPACMASLLTDNELLIAESNCLRVVKSNPTYILADTYNTGALTKTVSVNPYSSRKLDPNGNLGGLYVVELREKLIFNNGCVQPACFPNVNIPASDIDFNDCRIVGYGFNSDDTKAVPPSQLMEVKVVVSSASVGKGNLTVTRADGRSGATCTGDESAPVICSHTNTREWVTVGITTTVGFPCSSGRFTKPVYASLLQEASDRTYYNGIQRFKYANPDLFTA